MSKIKTLNKSTSVLTVKLDSELKKNAESILALLGVNASQAVKMFYTQILFSKGIPFDVRINDSNLDRIIDGLENNHKGLTFKSDEEWIEFWQNQKDKI